MANQQHRQHCCCVPEARKPSAPLGHQLPARMQAEHPSRELLSAAYSPQRGLFPTALSDCREQISCAGHPLPQASAGASGLVVSAQSRLCTATTPSTACHALLLHSDMALDSICSAESTEPLLKKAALPASERQQSQSQEGMQRALQQGSWLPALSSPWQWG